MYSSPRDEESVQAFITDFFASADSHDSDTDLSGIMNFNNSFVTRTVIIAKYLLGYYEYYST